MDMDRMQSPFLPPDVAAVAGPRRDFTRAAIVCTANFATGLAARAIARPPGHA
jgi:hypothetical protein